MLGGASCYLGVFRGVSMFMTVMFFSKVFFSPFIPPVSVGSASGCCRFSQVVFLPLSPAM
jgi:hypothetical protein